MQDLKDGEVQRRQRLGGMLTYYYCATACVVEFWTSGKQAQPTVHDSASLVHAPTPG
jgi:hypothetical protein